MFYEETSLLHFLGIIVFGLYILITCNLTKCNLSPHTSITYHLCEMVPFKIKGAASSFYLCG